MKNFKKIIAGLLALILVLAVFGTVPARAAAKFGKSTSIVMINEQGGISTLPRVVYTGDTIDVCLKSSAGTMKMDSSNKKVATVKSIKDRAGVYTVTFNKTGIVMITAEVHKGIVAQAIFTVEQGELVPKEKEIFLPANTVATDCPFDHITSIAGVTGPAVKVNYKIAAGKGIKVSKNGNISKISKPTFVSVTATPKLKKDKTRYAPAEFYVYVLPYMKLDAPVLENAVYPVKKAAEALNAAVDTSAITDEKVDIEYQWYQMTGAKPDVTNDTLIKDATNVTYTPDTEKAGINNYYCELLIHTPDKYSYLDTTILSGIAKIEVGGTVNITFDPNGGYFTNGSNPPAALITQEVEKGAAIDKLPFYLSHSEKDFAGWATDPNMTGPDVTKTSVFLEDTTLYAVWKEKENQSSPAPRIISTAAEGYDQYAFGPSDSIGHLFVEAEATGGGTITYQWYMDGSPIPDAVEASYTPEYDSTNVGQHTYYCKVTNTVSGKQPTSVTACSIQITFVG